MSIFFVCHHASGHEKHYKSAAVVLPKSAATTPKAATTDAPSGTHASFVTPDGKPPHIPTTPIVARKLDLSMKKDAAIMMNMALILLFSVASDAVVESTA